MKPPSPLLPIVWRRLWRRWSWSRVWSRCIHPDSYGYRPRRSALDAVRLCRQRCWETDWVIDLDLKSFLDVSSHCSLGSLS